MSRYTDIRTCINIHRIVMVMGSKFNLALIEPNIIMTTNITLATVQCRVT